MKYSQTLLKTLKECPSDELARNAQWLLRGGFIHKTMAGAYSFLPLGLRVLRKIENIVREEMNQSGASELLMTALAPKELWEKTGRWNKVDVLYKIETAHGGEVALNPTHEEVVTPLVAHFCQSPKDFPKCVYQIQTKFRNEPRAKSGILRGREFLMKDAYSFHLNQACFETYYERMKVAYFEIYKRLGLGEKTVIVAASGGDFSKFSHEFQTICEIGEDEIYQDVKTGEYWNKEIVEDPKDPKWKVQKAVEVGNIFPLSSRFSDAFGMKVDGQSVIMGCYGIGVSRLMGVIAEIFSDDKGLKWPTSVAPFQVYLAPIGKDEAVYQKAESLYSELESAGIEVLYDDRMDKKVGPGQKFADHELLGIPFRLVLSEKTLASGEAEVVERSTGNIEMVKFEDLIKKFR